MTDERFELRFGSDGNRELVDANENGGAQPVTESAYYSGNNVTILNSGLASMTWDILDTGTELFDRTDPALPVVLKDGLFIVAAQLQAITFTAGGTLRAELTFDYGGDSPFVANTGSFNRADTADLLIGGPYKLSAGMAIQLLLYNFDGAETRDFVIKNALVSRVGPA